MQNRKDNIDEERERIILTAAKLIFQEIKDLECDMNYYPSYDNIIDIEEGAKALPKSLKTLLDKIIPNKTKQVSIGQSILYAARPRSVIPTLLFGLGIELEYMYGSRWLINELYRLGFCITYEEAVRFKQSVLQSDDNTVVPHYETSFVQWSADNVDHNTVTIDGENTFHGMGIIAVATPLSTDMLPQEPLVKRSTKRLKVNQLIKNKGIPIIPYNGPSVRDLPKFTFVPLQELQVSFTLPRGLSSDMLWQISWILDVFQTQWSGFMSLIDNNEKPTKQNTYFQPMIDLNPNDETCVYSTLLYVQSHATKLGIPVPSVTFDQPLWLKAITIAEAKGMDIVCRLGGFHTLMSFLGSIGKVMEGSGIEEAIGVIYAEKVVPHCMSGKAVSRALRAHFTIDAVLWSLLSESLLLTDDPKISKKLSTAEKNDLKQILKKVFDGTCTSEEIVSSEVILSVTKEVDNYKETLQKESRTARLWIQYLNCISTVKMFIRAERTSDWLLHLYSLEQMLPLFASTGHHHYTKCARLYLQMMRQLPVDYPWLNNQFVQEKKHSVFRTDKHWRGIWSDLAIEQILMRSLKSRGGLTRGRGMTQSVRHQWVHTSHQSAAIHNAMSEVTKLETKTSEQHVELGVSRGNRDREDFEKMRNWFKNHNPFENNTAELRSLSTGLKAKDEVNCDRAVTIGWNLQKSLDNAHISEAKVKRSNQIRTIASSYNNVKVSGKTIDVDPSKLFNRLIAMAQREEDLWKYFDYELTTMPMSLFKDGLMRKTQKVQLKHSLVHKIEETTATGEVVIDGGFLLHKVRWRKGMTYQEVIDIYVKYVQQHYGPSNIVFDGYAACVTKDQEHQRSSSGKKTSANIAVNKTNISHKDQEALITSDNEEYGNIFDLLCDF